VEWKERKRRKGGHERERERERERELRHFADEAFYVLSITQSQYSEKFNA